VDLYDFQILVANWQKTPSGNGTPLGPVPEPATLGALAVGAWALLRRRRPSNR
jgi:hypothetical protein